MNGWRANERERSCDGRRVAGTLRVFHGGGADVQPLGSCFRATTEGRRGEERREEQNGRVAVRWAERLRLQVHSELVQQSWEEAGQGEGWAAAVEGGDGVGQREEAGREGCKVGKEGIVGG